MKHRSSPEDASGKMSKNVFNHPRHRPTEPTTPHGNFDRTLTASQQRQISNNGILQTRMYGILNHGFSATPTLLVSSPYLILSAIVSLLFIVAGKRRRLPWDRLRARRAPPRPARGRGGGSNHPFCRQWFRDLCLHRHRRAG